MSYKPITTPAPTHLLPETLLSALLKELNPLFIFLGNFTVNPEITMLTLIVNEDQCKPTTYGKIDALLEEQPQLMHRIYTEPYTQKQIREGNLFFIDNLLLGTIVYKDPETEFPFMPPELCLNDLIGRSKLAFEKEMKKIDAFNEGAITHFEQRQYTQSTFAYHQTFELLFRAAECALMGKNKITHRLREHQEFCTGFIPTLATFFNPNDSEEEAVLNLLDQSYCAARYQSDFEPTAEQIDMLYYKAEQLFTLVKSLFYLTWQRCYVASYKKDKADEALEEMSIISEELHNIPRETQIEPQKENTKVDTHNSISGNYETEDGLLVKVIELIKTKISLDSVFLISRQQEQKTLEVYLETSNPTSKSVITYTLFLVTNKSVSINPLKLMDYIYQKTGFCKVYAIYYKLSKVKVNYGNNFLDRTFSKAQIVFNGKLNHIDAKHSDYYHPKKVKKIRKIWKNHYNRASYLMALTFDYVEYEDNAVRVSIFHVALEQICIGLLRVFWDYKPHFFSISYLLHLCSHFTSIPATVFPRNSFSAHRLYNIICSGQNALRYQDKICLTYDDTQKAYNLVNHFLELSNKEASMRLIHLKELAEECKRLEG